MSAGTITLTNGSAIVGGSGTSFETELAAGDFVVAIVGGITYTLPVKSVESPASLTLIRAFPGPTQSGAAWNAIPRATQNQLTAELVAQTTEALRGLNYDKQNWQAIFSDDGNITVKLPDGTTFTGPSWKYLSDNMATKSGGAVPVNQGGTGSTTAEGARTNLGLGELSTAGVCGGSVTDSGYITIPIIINGARRVLYIQWGGFTGTTGGRSDNGAVYEASNITVTWPVTLPNAVFQVITGCSSDVSGSGQQEMAWCMGKTKTYGIFGFQCRTPNASMTGSYLVIGY